MHYKEKKFDDGLKPFTSGNIVLGCVIPLVLFWGGMLSPFFSKSIFVWILSLIPFYIYVFLGILVSNKKNANAFLLATLLSFITSIFLIVLLFLVPEELNNLQNICRLGLLNVAPSGVFMFITSANSVISRSKGGFCVPLIIDGDS